VTTPSTAWGKSEPPKEKEPKEKKKPQEKPKEVEKTLIQPSKVESFWEEEDDKPTFVFSQKSEEKKTIGNEGKKEKKKISNPTGSYASIVHTKQEAPNKKNQGLDKNEFPDLPTKSKNEKEDQHLTKIAKQGKGKSNIFGGIEPSETFKEWYKKQMSIMSKSQDLSLFYYLLSLRTKKRNR